MLLLKAKKFNVIQKKLENDHVYEVIEHPGAVVILPFLDDETIILIKNYRYSIDKTLIELPAGTLNKNEEPLSCAQRELIEETGYQSNTMKPLLNFYSSPGICNEVLHIFVVTDLNHVGQKLEETEKIEIHPVKFSDALQMVKDNRICDAKTIAALLYAAYFQLNRFKV